jgi:WD40 repeat protein
MASTFTGLKLQGNIGKFGKVDLSDISSFVELPDGKVVSGTETGAILLWEGNFIKCRFVRADPSSPRATPSATPRTRYPRSPRSNRVMCHQGEINYVALDRDERCVITAGDDGYIRWWDFDVIGTFIKYAYIYTKTNIRLILLMFIVRYCGGRYGYHNGLRSCTKS